MRQWSVGLVVLSMAVLLGPASADELSDLKEELQQQKTQSADLENRINQLEVRQRLKEESLRQKIGELEAQVDEEKAEADEPAAGLPDSLKWLERIKISGDFRYRYEYIDAETKSVRHRNRIRARAKISAMINDEWDVALQLGTGESDVLEDDMFPDPISGNQSLKQFSSRKPIWLDLAYFDYHPGAIKGLNVIGGKMEHLFLKVGKNQLMCDSDLNLEGVAATYAMSLGEKTEAFVNGGGFWVDESSSGVDTSLWGIQGYLKQAVGGPSHILGGAGFYDYGNIQGKSDEYGILFGNTPGPVDGDGNPTWASDFDILEIFGQYGTKMGKLPVAVFGTWVKNTAAVDGEDTGWLIGGTLGKAKDPGSWQLGYDYRDLERDAVLGIWADSDFGGGGTGSKGHVLRGAYQIAKGVQAALTYFHNEVYRSGPDLDFQCFQADIKLKF